MTNMAQDQRDFMYMGNQLTQKYDEEQVLLYTSLIKEEVNELLMSYLLEDKAETLKEATDVIVVTLGLIWSMGVNPNDVWNLVHANNMAKVNETVIKDENGKIMKSPESIARKEKMMESIRKLL